MLFGPFCSFCPLHFGSAACNLQQIWKTVPLHSYVEIYFKLCLTIGKGRAVRRFWSLGVSEKMERKSELFLSATFSSELPLAWYQLKQCYSVCPKAYITGYLSHLEASANFLEVLRVKRWNVWIMCCKWIRFWCFVSQWHGRKEDMHCIQQQMNVEN